MEVLALLRPKGAPETQEYLSSLTNLRVLKQLLNPTLYLSRLELIVHTGLLGRRTDTLETPCTIINLPTTGMQELVVGPAKSLR